MKNPFIEIFVIKASKLNFKIIFGILFFIIYGILLYIFKEPLFKFFKFIPHFIINVVLLIFKLWYVLAGVLLYILSFKMMVNESEISQKYDFTDKQEKLYTAYCFFLTCLSFIISNFKFIFVHKFNSDIFTTNSFSTFVMFIWLVITTIAANFIIMAYVMSE